MQTPTIFPFNSQTSEEQKGRGAKGRALTDGAALSTSGSGNHGFPRQAPAGVLPWEELHTTCREVQHRFLGRGALSVGVTPRRGRGQLVETRPDPRSPAGSAQINMTHAVIPSHPGHSWLFSGCFSQLFLFFPSFPCSHGRGRSRSRGAAGGAGGCWARGSRRRITESLRLEKTSKIIKSNQERGGEGCSVAGKRGCV